MLELSSPEDLKPRTRKLKTRKTRDEGRRGVLRQLDAIAATKRELQRISTIYVGGKKVTCALARARNWSICVMSMVVQYRWCGSVRCGQRISRARALAEQSRHRRHRRVVQRRARAPRPGLGLRGERREGGRQAPRLLGREHMASKRSSQAELRASARSARPAKPREGQHRIQEAAEDSETPGGKKTTTFLV